MGQASLSRLTSRKMGRKGGSPSFKIKSRGESLPACVRLSSPAERGEIIVDLEGPDWSAQTEVLSTLNSLYADVDVWMTYGQFMYYPSFEKGFAAPIPPEVIEGGDFRNLKGYVSHLRTFYAALQEINKQDLLHEERFIPDVGDLAFLLPILEMAGEHARFIPDVLYVFNYTFPASSHRSGGPLAEEMDQRIRSKNRYFPLPALPLNPSPSPLPPDQRHHPSHLKRLPFCAKLAGSWQKGQSASSGKHGKRSQGDQTHRIHPRGDSHHRKRPCQL